MCGTLYCTPHGPHEQRAPLSPEGSKRDTSVTPASPEQGGPPHNPPSLSSRLHLSATSTICDTGTNCGAITLLSAATPPDAPDASSSQPRARLALACRHAPEGETAPEVARARSNATSACSSPLSCPAMVRYTRLRSGPSTSSTVWLCPLCPQLLQPSSSSVRYTCKATQWCRCC